MTKKWQKLSLVLFLIFGFCLTQSLPVSALGHVWGTPIDVANSGEYTSLVVIDGNPACSYYDNQDLKYIRASDTNGTTWGSVITLDSTGVVGQYNSLAVINGNPAISYFDNSNVALKYIRATNASGTTWGTPITVESGGVVGQYTSLALVNGNPAISYYDMFAASLKYVRANDANGTSWSTPITVDNAGSVGEYTSLAIIDGNPAISYFDRTNTQLKYVRAMDASGTTWGTPVTVDNAGFVGEYTSLAIIDGNPAISYYDRINGNLKYSRALDPSGSSWSTPITVDGTGNVGLDTSMAVVNGRPAISYYDNSTSSLKYVSANNADGTSWGTPSTLDGAGNSGRDSSLAMVNGQPAISYNSIILTTGDMRYIRATGTVDIIVWNGSAEIENNTSTLDFGTTLKGVPVSIMITIQNTGTQPLDLETPTLPSGFSLVGSFENSIAAGGSTTMTLQLDAATTGAFSGNFSLVNTDGENTPFNIALTGTVSLLNEPIFAPDTNIIDFGNTTVGNPTIALVNIENPNAAPLRLTVSTIPDGFSLVGTFDDPIPANSSTSMNLQLDAVTSGDFSGTLALESDDAENSPYEFTLIGTVETSINGVTTLPNTGFTPGQFTKLPVQPVEKAYANTTMLLEIPTLNVRSTIVSVPQTEDSWDVTWLGSNAGYLNGTAFPTWNGNTVLTGHVWDAYNHAGIFADFKTLQYGDQIKIQAWDLTYTYEIRENKRVSASNVKSALQHEELDWLTLITCEGYNPFSGEYLFRRMVRAVLVEIR